MKGQLARKDPLLSRPAPPTSTMKINEGIKFKAKGVLLQKKVGVGIHAKLVT
jgi:hypothetical protein